MYSMLLNQNLNRTEVATLQSRLVLMHGVECNVMILNASARDFNINKACGVTFYQVRDLVAR